MLTRRTVAQGAAWTVPLVMSGVGAPAYAVSGCVVQTNFDALTVGTMPGVLTFKPSTVTATIAYSSTGNGGDATPGGTGTVARTSTTPAWNYIEVEMLKTLVQGDSVTVTITLTQAVNNLSFRIHDIDTDTTAYGLQWLDHVVVTTSGYSYARGADVTGVGTAAEPFRNTKPDDQPIDSGRNHVDLTWTGPVSAVTFVYRAGANGSSGNQHIGLGNISFDDCVVASKATAAYAARRSPSTSTAARSHPSSGDS